MANLISAGLSPGSRRREAQERVYGRETCLRVRRSNFVLLPIKPKNTVSEVPEEKHNVCPNEGALKW